MKGCGCGGERREGGERKRAFKNKKSPWTCRERERMAVVHHQRGTEQQQQRFFSFDFREIFTFLLSALSLALSLSPLSLFPFHFLCCYSLSRPLSPNLSPFPSCLSRTPLGHLFKRHRAFHEGQICPTHFSESFSTSCRLSLSPHPIYLLSICLLRRFSLLCASLFSLSI